MLSDGFSIKQTEPPLQPPSLPRNAVKMPPLNSRAMTTLYVGSDVQPVRLIVLYL